MDKTIGLPSPFSVIIERIPFWSSRFQIFLFEIPIGTDLASLHALGSKGIDSYVLSGFKTLPPRVILRTDFKQAEVETLNEETINILLENVET